MKTIKKILIDSISMKDLLLNKYVLIDTCFLSALQKYPSRFEDLLANLNEHSEGLCVNPLIRLEYLRIAKNAEEKSRIENSLDKFPTLPLEGNVLEEVERIYPLYNLCQSIRNNKQVSLVDAYAVAYLNTYTPRLLFLTFDNGDFPLEILDRISTGAIDVKTQIFTWGLYQINHEKLAKLKKIYTGI